MHVREQEHLNYARCYAVCYVIISKLAHIYAHAMTYIHNFGCDWYFLMR